MIRLVLMGLCCFSFVYVYCQDKAMEMAEEIERIESLSRNDDDSGIDEIGALISTTKPFAVRRVAIRVLASNGSGAALNRLEKVKDIGVLSPCLEMALVRCKARKNAAGLDLLLKDLIAVWSRYRNASGLPGKAKDETTQDKTWHGIQPSLASEELSFHAVDANLPISELPDEVKNLPDSVYGILRGQVAPSQDKEKILKFLLKSLQSGDLFVREGAARLLAEKGSDAIPFLGEFVRRNIPSEVPPPFKPIHGVFSASLQAVASIGGQRAEELLTQLKGERNVFVSRNVAYYLSWIQRGKRFPIKYFRLINGGLDD